MDDSQILLFITTYVLQFCCLSPLTCYNFAVYHHSRATILLFIATYMLQFCCLSPLTCYNFAVYHHLHATISHHSHHYQINNRFPPTHLGNQRKQTPTSLTIGVRYGHLLYCSEENEKCARSTNGTLERPEKSSFDTGTFLLITGHSWEEWGP